MVHLRRYSVFSLSLLLIPDSLRGIVIFRSTPAGATGRTGQPPLPIVIKRARAALRHDLRRHGLTGPHTLDTGRAFDIGLYVDCWILGPAISTMFKDRNT